MPTFKLFVKATFENVESIEVEQPDWFHFKVQCCNCRTNSPNVIGISTTETVEVVKNVVNFQYRCKECKREHTMSIVKNSIKPITHEQSGQWAPVVEFDCRGIEPVEPELSGTKWTVQSADDGAAISGVELDEDWADYDPKNDVPLSILDIEVKVE